MPVSPTAFHRPLPEWVPCRTLERFNQFAGGLPSLLCRGWCVRYAFSLNMPAFHLFALLPPRTTTTYAHLHSQNRHYHFVTHFKPAAAADCHWRWFTLYAFVCCRHSGYRTRVCLCRADETLTHSSCRAHTAWAHLDLPAGIAGQNPTPPAPPPPPGWWVGVAFVPTWAYGGWAYCGA